MKIWDRGWEPGGQNGAKSKPRLERARSELPRGGKDIAAQIGAELRIVFGPPAATELRGADEMLSQIDGWSRESSKWDRG